MRSLDSRRLRRWAPKGTARRSRPTDSPAGGLQTAFGGHVFRRFDQAEHEHVVVDGFVVTRFDRVGLVPDADATVRPHGPVDVAALVQYWRSFENLERFAHDLNDPHFPAWRHGPVEELLGPENALPGVIVDPKTGSGAPPEWAVLPDLASEHLPSAAPGRVRVRLTGCSVMGAVPRVRAKER